MGRLKIKRTAKQLADKTRKDYDRLNKRRRKRYREDQKYRQSCKSVSRITARKSSDNQSPELQRQAHCKSVVGNLVQYAERREIVEDGELTGRTQHTLTSRELAPLLGLSHVVMLHKWQRADKFPRPTVIASTYRPHAGVYTIPQARALIKVMIRHYSTKSYLSVLDDTTITDLFAAMD